MCSQLEQHESTEQFLSQVTFQTDVDDPHQIADKVGILILAPLEWG